MTDMLEVLRQEHRNIESLLRVLERELSVFDHGERPDYEILLAVIDYFEDYPDSCHHPKEDMKEKVGRLGRLSSAEPRLQPTNSSQWQQDRRQANQHHEQFKKVC